MQETHVRLRIRSDRLTPEQISASLGVNCDRCWHTGELRAQTIIKEPDNGWVLNSGLPASATLEEHVQSILRILEPLTPALQSLSAMATTELSCVVYAESEPALYFDKTVIQKLGFMGVALDIDLYIYNSR